MKEVIDELHELCETVSNEIADANEKIRTSNGKLSAGDVEYLDKLTHMLKSIKTTVAMMESEEDGGYSGRYMPTYGGMSYERGGNRVNSYARGRGTNARRDSMGRYSNRGYSYADGMDSLLVEMREIMTDLPDEKRREVQRFVDKMERM